jgi:hypothetical protein
VLTYVGHKPVERSDLNLINSVHGKTHNQSALTQQLAGQRDLF